MKPLWQTLAVDIGLDLSPNQIESLLLFRDWLEDEALPAGGIGPTELNRIDSRHIGDSLLFSSLLPDGVAPVWDLGTGVGLPGVPLAIAHPERSFQLIDRSGRRVGLLRRLLRILELDNCQVEQAEIDDLVGPTEVIVSRATLPPNTLSVVVSRLLAPGGVAIAGGSWTNRPEHPGWQTVEIASDVLARPVWLLMMQRE